LEEMAKQRIKDEQKREHILDTIFRTKERIRRRSSKELPLEEGKVV
jgi:hypothetical protein